MVANCGKEATKMFKKVIIFAGIIILVILFALFYKYNFALSSKGISNVIIKGENFNVEVAKTPAEQAKGLSGRDGLPSQGGMLFPFKDSAIHPFWMKDMKFPIDIVWIQDNTVVGVEENMAPGGDKQDSELRIYTPPSPINTVLEVAAGTVARLGIKSGDAISIKL